MSNTSDNNDSATNLEKLSTEELVKSWFHRLRRSHALYVEHFREEQFEELVSTAVTSAFVERALLIGIQIAGFTVDLNKKFSFPLETLIRIAARQGWLSRDLRKLLNKFSAVRNDVLHDIDYRLTAGVVGELRALLPPESEARMQRALSSIIDPSTGVIAVLVYEQIAMLAFEASQSAAPKLSEEAVP